MVRDGLYVLVTWTRMRIPIINQSFSRALPLRPRRTTNLPGPHSMEAFTKSPLGLVTGLGNGSPQTDAVMWLSSSLSAASCDVPLCELVVVLGVDAYGVYYIVLSKGRVAHCSSQRVQIDSVRANTSALALPYWHMVISYYYSLDRLTWLDAFIHRRKRKSKKIK